MRHESNEDVETQSKNVTDDSTDVEECESAVMVPSEFNPLYVMITFDETLTTRKKVCLAIVITSDTESSYDLCVVGGGHALQLQVIIPPVVSCAELLHDFWLKGDGDRISMDHPKIGNSVKELKERRDTASHVLLSLAHIRFLFKVETVFTYEVLCKISAEPTTCFLYL